LRIVDAIEQCHRRRFAGTGGADERDGLAQPVVRGLTEAMGGTVDARRGRLGGLAVTLRLPAMALPDDETPGR